MARKFLYLVALLTVLLIAALFALRIWSRELTEFAFVPRTEFVEQSALQPNAYDDPAMWFSRPGMNVDDDPSRWQPTEHKDRNLLPTPAEPKPAALPPFAVFFVHPTSFLDKSKWNAPLGDGESQDRARIFLQGMASPFAAATEIWAPRYRQATFGAFLIDSPEANLALDAAYQDIAQAFDYFIQSIPKDEPIILAGHSQGALHITRLLHDKVAGTPLAARVIAAYPVGWPISLEHDLPGLGLPACAAADQPGCVMSWLSFAEPADPGMVMDRYATSLGFDGFPRGDSTILCVNPLTGGASAEAGADRNTGTLVPDVALKHGKIAPRMVPARCDERGLLLIGDPPDMGPYVLPGNNYHVYDIPLFWKNLQADVENRARAWTASR